LLALAQKLPSSHRELIRDIDPRPQEEAAGLESVPEIGEYDARMGHLALELCTESRLGFTARRFPGSGESMKASEVKELKLVAPVWAWIDRF
jgi:hypothetical protein